MRISDWSSDVCSSDLTDADGSEELNLKLSQDRAASVKAALTSEFGIAAERMVTGGKGESVPVAGNDTSEGKAKNRRVEFVKRYFKLIDKPINDRRMIRFRKL